MYLPNEGSISSSATSSYMGEGFIKNLTNAKEGRHPCMIVTSNTDFSANSQVMRRIYYIIHLNNPFDSSKKIETAEYFTTLLNDFGTDLYKMRHNGFKEDKKTNIILLDDEIVFGTKMSANREKRELLQYLPIGVLVEEKGIVKLNLVKFFRFIDQKSKNNGFFKRHF